MTEKRWPIPPDVLDKANEIVERDELRSRLIEDAGAAATKPRSRIKLLVVADDLRIWNESNMGEPIRPDDCPEFYRALSELKRGMR